eukprot:30674-Pelagococcus_subviridis.AAC.2
MRRRERRQRLRPGRHRKRQPRGPQQRALGPPRKEHVQSGRDEREVHEQHERRRGRPVPKPSLRGDHRVFSRGPIRRVLLFARRDAAAAAAPGRRRRRRRRRLQIQILRGVLHPRVPAPLQRFRREVRRDEQRDGRHHLALPNRRSNLVRERRDDRAANGREHEMRREHRRDAALRGDPSHRQRVATRHAAREPRRAAARGDKRRDDFRARVRDASPRASDARPASREVFRASQMPPKAQRARARERERQRGDEDAREDFRVGRARLSPRERDELGDAGGEVEAHEVRRRPERSGEKREREALRRERRGERLSGGDVVREPRARAREAAVARAVVDVVVEAPQRRRRVRRRVVVVVVAATADADAERRGRRRRRRRRARGDVSGARELPGARWVRPSAVARVAAPRHQRICVAAAAAPTPSRAREQPSRDEELVPSHGVVREQ